MAAHLINQGELPDLRKNTGDFFFLRRRQGEDALRTILELSGRVPEMKAKIRFDDHGEKLLLLKYAKIRPAD